MDTGGSFNNNHNFNGSVVTNRQSNSFAFRRRSRNRSGSVVSESLDSDDRSSSPTTVANSATQLPPAQSYFHLQLQQAVDCEVLIYPSLLYAVVAGDHARALARRQLHSADTTTVASSNTQQKTGKLFRDPLSNSVVGSSQPGSLSGSPNAKEPNSASPHQRGASRNDDDWDVVADATHHTMSGRHPRSAHGDPVYCHLSVRSSSQPFTT